jgi:hypothetical protein
MTNVIFIIDNFGLELYFFGTQAFPKNRGHMLMTKIDIITILSARLVRLVS